MKCKRVTKGTKTLDYITVPSRTSANNRNFINCLQRGIRQSAIIDVCLQLDRGLRRTIALHNMEYRVSAPSTFTPANLAASRRTSNIFTAPTKGTFTRNGIYTIEEPKKKQSKRPNAKEYEIIYKAYLEIREERTVLRRENQKLHEELLDTRGRVLALSQENEEIKEQLLQLRQTADWGQIIRGKDEELKRLQEFIRKMSYDKAEAINNKSLAEQAVGELKSKLRRKDREVQEAKELEKIQSKAKILNETEKLRNQRDNAIANLTQHEALVEKLRQETSNVSRMSEERKMVIQELHKRLTTKDKQVEELRKQLVVSRLFNK